MLVEQKIRLVSPNTRYIDSYLDASAEFCRDGGSNGTFYVAKLSEHDREKFSNDILSFEEEIVRPSLNDDNGKVSFTYWIIIDGNYAGEIYIRNREIDRTSVKSIAKPQKKWYQIYGDMVDRCTILSMILRPSARNHNNMAMITCLMFDKLRELGFDEFVVNCYKADKCLNYKIYQMCCLCGGKHRENLKTVEYVVPVKPDVMRSIVRNKLLQDAISVSKSFGHLIKELKDCLDNDIHFLENCEEREKNSIIFQ